MNEAYDNQDEKLYRRLYEIRSTRLNNLLRIQSDLVYYGKFTYSDVQKMKVIERRYFITEINNRIKEMNKAREKAQAKAKTKPVRRKKR